MAKLDHLILKVNDLAASVAFYTGILGFKNAQLKESNDADGSAAAWRRAQDIRARLT